MSFSKKQLNNKEQLNKLDSAELSNLEEATKASINMESYVQEAPLNPETEEAIKKQMAENGVMPVPGPRVVDSLKWSVIVTGCLVILSMYIPHDGNQSLLRFWIRTVIQANTVLVIQQMKNTSHNQKSSKKKRASGDVNKLEDLQ